MYTRNTHYHEEYLRVCVKRHVGKVLRVSKTRNRILNSSVILRFVHQFSVGAHTYRDSEYLLEFATTQNG